MVDNNLKAPKKEAQEFAPLPENVYQVELLDVTSEQRATYDTRLKPANEQLLETVLSFQFTLLSGKQDGESLRGRNVWANFTPCYLYISAKNGKNRLYQIVEALLDRELSPLEEADGIDGAFLNGLIGKQCRIGTKHKQSGEKVFDNIETYYPSEQDMPSLTAEEKDKATVKNKKGTKTVGEKGNGEDIEYPVDSEPVVDENGIPF